MKMLGKGKKIVSVAHKEKLLAEIAHYEKRIEEALTKPKNYSFVNESSDEEINPYKLKDQQSWFELKQQDASLTDRVSKTLELAMLTIMQSEVNVMVTPPQVRRPVQEDGVWLEVAAECKIDLVSFTITFYAHKPHRRYAPTRYRNVVVALIKPAHQKELAQSVLPKLNRPHLALQVLQSYATAFRSRRTTLLELAAKYEDKLKMEAMPEGGYRVRFLNLLQVEWTLENMWSPIVPFCHRMKFEVEYMPKDYIHAIGKLYKQFKDPSLETSERTHVLSEILDTCLQARGLAREIQDSFESDPETASLQHERRTTIDQEPDVPNVELSPKKPKGKENKVQNRKTTMAPPKTIPKKAKKVAKGNERKSVKRTMDDEASSANDNKKSRIDEENNRIDEVKNKAGLKGGSDGVDDKDTEASIGSKSNVQKINTRIATGNTKDIVVSTENEKSKSSEVAKCAKEIDKANTTVAENVKKTRDSKSVKSKSASGNSEVSGDGNANRKRDANSIDSAKDKESVSSEVASKKKSKKDEQNNVNSKDMNTESNFTSSKNVPDSNGNTNNDGYKIANAKNGAKNVPSTKTNEGIAKTKSETKIGGDGESIATSKDNNTVSDVAISKNRTTKGDGQNSSSKDKTTESNSIKSRSVKNTETASSKTRKDDGNKIKVSSKNLKNEDDGLSRKVSQKVDTETNVGKTRDVKKSKEIVKKIASKEDTVKSKAIAKNVASKKTDKERIVEINSDQGYKLKESGKDVDKIQALKGKHTDNKLKPNDKNKETVHVTEKKKVVNTKTSEQKSEQDKNKAIADKPKVKVSDVQRNKKDEIFTKKNATKSDFLTKNNEQTKKIDKAESKSIPKSAENVTKNVLKEKTNSDDTQKAKTDLKNDEKTKTNNQNTLNVTVTKSKTTSKDQILADKLKTKIPIMKNKMSFASLREKVFVNNIGRMSKAENPKVAQKLPVFKKVVKNLPTRISPRKLPSTFKPSSRGFLTK